MRILYFNPVGSLGGAERALLELITSVRAARPDWGFELLTGGEGDFTSLARESGIDVHVMAMPSALDRLGDAGAGGPAGGAISKPKLMIDLGRSIAPLASYSVRLRRFIRQRGPRLIHSNGFKTHILSAWAAPRRCRLIWHVHDYVSSRPLMSHLMHLHARRCDRAIANSDSVARDLSTVCGAGLTIHTIHNAVDLRRFNPCGPLLDLDRLSGLAPAPEGTIRVGLVATMARWKGHEVFLRALSMLDWRFPIRGYIVGGPIYDTLGSQYSVAQLRSVASMLGLEGMVGFTGFVGDPSSAIRALDIAVHASTQPEPFGLSVAEAMACGRPVIVSNLGGVTEIISNETALTHQPGDAAALAAAVMRLAADHHLRQALGAAARRRAELQFNPDRVAQQAERIYESTAS